MQAHRVSLQFGHESFGYRPFTIKNEAARILKEFDQLPTGSCLFVKKEDLKDVTGDPITFMHLRVALYQVAGSQNKKLVTRMRSDEAFYIYLIG